jgi:acetoacetate decarboxylase
MRRSIGFEFLDDGAYLIPVTLTDPDKLVRKPIERYESNTRHCVTYLTDYDALAKLLPPGFSPTEEPTIQVNYTTCMGIDYMAGRGYSLVGVDALVRFDGEVDHLEGYFGLVLWMDKYLPMVMGREIMGAAKILSEVPPMRCFDGRKCFSMSEEGSLLIEGEFWDLKELSKTEIAARLAAGGDRQWLGWKYIPNVTSDGADISCPTYLPVKRDVRQMWSAKGKLAFHETPWENAPLSGPIVNKLIKMPIIKYLDAWVQEDACDYLFRQHRVLK